MKIKRLFLTALAALVLATSAACAYPTNEPRPQPVYVTVYDDGGYIPYSWQWFYYRRHHHRPYEGHGGYRNYDQPRAIHHR